MKIIGYRSKKPWKMAMATFFYGLVLMVIVIAVIDPSTEDNNDEADNNTPIVENADDELEIEDEVE